MVLPVYLDHKRGVNNIFDTEKLWYKDYLSFFCPHRMAAAQL